MKTKLKEAIITSKMESTKGTHKPKYMSLGPLH